ncbi:YheV family putative zinc ribbon protein [Alkalimarinus alittae]|uniref:YheV family putative metal-binding protein n=1 Tax=Alkalimarinus alittae TaxID=2961619 RepID=A0ABY6N1X9_9ALTE|nr:YheV family putative zinc ribbon protein [Alkalimarinus alittae]UZE96117.1 YheV family putative metal-binding protein [Alkalimarinus alittae]
MKQHRRFIAGAVCPKCAEMDRLITYSSEDGSYRECVSCGYTDKQMDEEETRESDVLETRVNLLTPMEVDEDVVALKIIDPSARPDDSDKK